jgi:hypothetical protein
MKDDREREYEAHQQDERWTRLTHKRDRNDECRDERELGEKDKETEG